MNKNENGNRQNDKCMQENQLKLFETIGNEWQWMKSQGNEMNRSEMKWKNVHQNKEKEKKM